MPLKLRPTGLGSGINKDRPDNTVYTGEWEIGRIYQTRGGPDTLRRFWSMTVNGPMTRSERVATLEEAKAGVVSDPGASSASNDLGSRKKEVSTDLAYHGAFSRAQT
jgi:hypothetical protein